MHIKHKKKSVWFKLIEQAFHFFSPNNNQYDIIISLSPISTLLAGKFRAVIGLHRISKNWAVLLIMTLNFSLEVSKYFC